jgi:hypothetical protein
MKLFTRPMAAYANFSFLLLLLFFTFNAAFAQVRMRANLFITDNTGATLMNGNMTNYSNTYSNAVDGYDIWKMSNFGENFGILRTSANLVIERRSLISVTDTTYFRMWNVQPRNYRIQVIAENLHTFNLVAFMRDKFLHQDTPVDLNDTTDINFTVTGQAASYVNILAGPLPVTFTGILAQRHSNDISVSWTVENESSMQKYVVEHSADGVHFKDSHEVDALNSSFTKTYAVNDAQSGSIDHYYRIKAISISGKTQYSSVARVSALSAKTAMSLNIYPNPVVNKTIQMQINAVAAGNYTMSLIDMGGRELPLGTLKLAAGQSNQSIKIPAQMAAGLYRLKIITADNQILIKTVTVL